MRLSLRLALVGAACAVPCLCSGQDWSFEEGSRSRFFPRLDMQLSSDFHREARKVEIRVNGGPARVLHNFGAYDPDSGRPDEDGIPVQDELRRKLTVLRGVDLLKTGANIVQLRFFLGSGPEARRQDVERVVDLPGRETKFGPVLIVEDGSRQEFPMPDAMLNAMGDTLRSLTEAYLAGRELKIEVGHSNSFRTKNGMKLLSHGNKEEAVAVVSHEFAHILFDTLSPEEAESFRLLYHRLAQVPAKEEGGFTPTNHYEAAAGSVIAWFNESNFVSSRYPLGHAYDNPSELFASSFNAWKTYPGLFTQKFYGRASPGQRRALDELFAFLAGIKR
ncbi:MAG: hypothetical protein HZB91_04225 [Elusimicrobia bacterium]|nr:hypothetical protein [Elusimicrobiota bacterium]